MSRFSLCLVAFVLAAAPAGADPIDAALHREAPQLIAHCRAKGYANVGILRFGVRLGDGPLNHQAGPLNGNMATRLENALIVANDLRQPVGVVRDAAAVVAKEHGARASVADAAGRRALFDLDYPLAWGDGRVRVDALLGGTVALGADRKRAKVEIVAFDRTGAAPATVATFDVAVDRTILADAGQTFLLGRRSLAGHRTADALDAAAADAPARPATLGEYLDFTVCYDDKEQPLTADADGKGGLRAPSPQVGQKLSVTLRNKTAEPLGFVLRVNGQSHLLRSRAAPVECPKGVLPDGATYVVPGFYDEEDRLTPIVAVERGDARVASEMADRLGLIEIALFVPAAKTGGEVIAAARDADPTLISRGLSFRAPRAAATPKTLREAKQLVARASGLIGAKEVFVAANVPGEKRTLKTVPFADPVHVGTVVVRYFDATKGQ